MNPSEYYGLSNAQMAALLQAQSVLSLLSKLTADVVNMAHIDADESASAALLAHERLQRVLDDLGGPSPPMFYVNRTEEDTDHAR